MDRLTAVDASFLTNESSASHMHVGGVMIFEGPPPRYIDFVEHVRSRLHLVPRYRQKLAFPPIETGRPFWIDDPNFNLEYHIRHSALPAPAPRSSCATSPAASSPSSSTARSRSGRSGSSRGSRRTASRSSSRPTTR